MDIKLRLLPFESTVHGFKEGAGFAKSLFKEVFVFSRDTFSFAKAIFIFCRNQGRYLSFFNFVSALHICIVNSATTYPPSKKNKMATAKKATITVENTVIATIEKVWEYWTLPEHIIKWNNASADWHTPRAENDLRIGGKFFSRMEAKDGSFGFDFIGVYDEVKTNEQIAYTLEDGRKVNITFTSIGNATNVVEIFEAETENSVELQRGGWQAILDNFKKYTENS